MKQLALALVMMVMSGAAFAQSADDLKIDYGAKSYDWTREYNPQGDYAVQQKEAVAFRRELQACRRAVERLGNILNERAKILYEGSVDHHDYGWIMYPGPDLYYRDMSESWTDFDYEIRQLFNKRSFKKEQCYDFIEKWDRDKFFCLFQNTMDNRTIDNPKCVPEVYARFLVPGGNYPKHDNNWTNGK